MQSEEKTSRILIVEADEATRNRFQNILDPSPSNSSPFKFRLDFASHGQEAYEKIVQARSAEDPYALLFVEMNLPSEWNGAKIITEAWKLCPDLEVILCSSIDEPLPEKLQDETTKAFLKKHEASRQLVFLKKPLDQVQVQLLALSQTAKWKLAVQLQAHVENLDTLVRSRSQEQKKISQSEKLASLGVMAGGIAHEINNPLATINLLAGQMKELIHEGDLNPEDLIRNLTGIEKTVTYIAKIIKGLLRFSQSTESDPMVKASIREILDQALSFCQQKLKENGIDLKVDPVDESLATHCRPEQIVQVILNLLNNSVDAIQDLGEKWIQIRVQETPNSVLIRVSDSGLGIPEPIRDKIFDPFFTTKEIGKGTGLGLSISKGIIDSHGGTLSLDDASEVTQFVISLPKEK